ncbi:Nitrate reductase [Tepidimonas sediminis]|uniref:Nitrate reductase n=1 Tax=Tepidimonas sediminis TaxID=2588941 RepID=A0A554WSC4_9BURK|nr:nitrate reductase [Tepidimonas sediminis]TSE26479.1 Nitrate reductase [Tepidimonas sediminis]
MPTSTLEKPVTPPSATAEGTRVTRSTCPYCGVGCGVLIESRGDRVVGVRGDPQHPANFGRLCTKGSTLHLTANPLRQTATRLLQPMLRTSRDTPPRPVAWDQALNHVADRLAAIIRRDGPQAVGFYVSGQLLTEDYYVFHKLARGLIGTPHIDSNSRLCMSSAVVGYKLTLGADAPPACYEDLDHADCVFIAGSNTAWAHPVLFRRLEEAKARRPQMRIIVADPRRTDTCSLADLHLALQPGTDVMLFHGLLHVMEAQGWVDREYIERHTQGYEELRELAQAYPPELVAQVCAISMGDLLTAARWLAGVPEGWPAGVPLPRDRRLRTLSLYCQGLNQSTSGTAKNASLINLHLACGQIGRPGAGPLSLTGQPNAMGGREVGAMATLFSAHRDLTDAAHRLEMARLWGLLPDAALPDRPGLTAVEMFEAAARGQIKALWIACTNPAQSMPDQATVRQALDRAELVIVQEAYQTAATCQWADVLLPATTWGEKEGTVTNSERRISRVRAAVSPPRGHTGEEPWPDWRIAAEVGRRLEARLPARSAASLFPYRSPEEVWNEHRESTRGRDLDITGLSYARLEQAPQQWPCPDTAAGGSPRLYTDGRFPTPDGKARFVAFPYEPVAEDRCQRYPYALLTGRLRDQWHGMTRTATVGGLFGHVGEPVVWMHPDDLREEGLRAGDLVRLESRRGHVVLPAMPSDEVQRRQCFVPMHWGGEYLGGASSASACMGHGINGLTLPAVCPRSRQPELKHAAVRIEPARLGWRLHAMAWLPPDKALRAQAVLRKLLTRFDYAVCVPFGTVTTTGPSADDPAQDDAMTDGLLFKAAAERAPADSDWLLQLCEELELDGPDVVGLDDAPRRFHRRLRWSDPAHGDEGRPLAGFLLSGRCQSAEWMEALLRRREPVVIPTSMLLMDLRTPPTGAAPPLSPIVCQCVGVSEAAIVADLRGRPGDETMRLHGLQQALGCGTQCGSCLPQLKRLLRAHPPSPTAAMAGSEAEGALR